MSSILNDTKLQLGLDPEYTVLDSQIITHVNSAFAELNQIGAGPEQGYEITDESDEWEAFIGTNPKLNLVKTYVYAFARMLFDPPQTGYLVDALKAQLDKLAWRINVLMEETIWVDPTPNLTNNDVIIDGGES